MAFNFNSINSLQEFNNIFQRDVNQISASLEEQMEFEKAFNEATARQNQIQDKLSMRTNIDVRLDTINANKIENLSDSTRMMNAFGDSIKGSINSLNTAQRNAEKAVETLASGGDISIHESKDAFRTIYDPTHPDADENGMLTLPNVNVVEEMVNMVNASKAYEASATVANTTKTMIQAALGI